MLRKVLGGVRSIRHGGFVAMVYLCFANLCPAQTVITYHATGTAAQISSFNSGNTFGSLYFNQNGLGATANNYLFFSMTTFDSNFNVLVSYFGFGPIPNDSVQGDATGLLTLNLDMSKAVYFSLCTVTPNVGAVCNSAPAGLIVLAWKRNALFSSHSVDNMVGSYPGVRYQVSGNSDNSLATVQGSILGIPLVQSFANLGVQRESSHSVFIP